MSEPIQFDRAEYVDVTALQCKLCGRPLEGQYYDVGGATICSSCRDTIEQGNPGAAGWNRFLRAVAYGLTAAVVGAAVYAAIVSFTGYQFGLVAVVLGFVIGKAVRVGSDHRGGWRYQALAMFLTYAAICAQFVPLLTRRTNVILAVIYSLAAPFFMIYSKDILAVVILGIGLYEAWKLNQRSGRGIAGPFPISPSSATAAVEGSKTLGN